MRRITIAAAILVAGIATASALDFGKPILGLDGKPIPISETDKAPITLRKVASDALIANDPRESLAPDVKAKRFWLALKIVKPGNVDLTAEETSMVKAAIGNLYGPLIVGRATELLDPAATPPASPGK